MNKNNFSVFAMLMLASTLVKADSSICDVVGGTYVAWPTAEPIWEMCYLSPADSSAAQGSSLEIRNVHLNGHLVLEKSHVPMLFANYDGNTCYRDWKNTNSSFIAASGVENPTTPARTTCDVSTNPTDSNGVGNCPFGLSGSCMSGVQVEKYEDRLVLTTNHSAAWYKYASRYVFFADGRFQPRFGFGNSDGTNFNTNHYHLAYWRLNFDIDGSDNDEVYIMDDLGQQAQTTEFFDFREITSGLPNDPNVYTDEVTWLVKDSVTGRGFQMVPGYEGDSQQGFINDYALGPNPGGDGYHNVDVMVSNYRLINGTLPEYSDTPGSNSLGDCGMDEENIINGESLTGVNGNPVFWYRTAVNDLAGQGMLCKTGGPMFYPVGDWGLTVDQAPTAVADVSVVDKNSIDNVVDVLTNDTDPDGGAKFVEFVTQPDNGSVTIGVDGANVLYSPDLDYCNNGNTTDDFTYTLNLGSVGSVSMGVDCLDLIFETSFE